MLKNRVTYETTLPASTTLAKLSALVEYANVRHMPQMYFVLNVLFLWDAHIVNALQKWQQRHASHLATWLNTIADYEVLSSLSILKHDHSDWTFPRIITDGSGFKAQQLGHPLLDNAVRRCNDVDLDPTPGITIVTGSNMSGKSTLLRTVGINLVLAYAGAPVCATNLTCKLMPIYTSMRIRDDLAKSISTFYSELLKIKSILDAINNNENTVLILIDEIFRGTNSHDRYEGAVAVIKRLLKANTIALISTHDLALCDLERYHKDKISNIHFSEIFTDTGMEFDYILRPGISTTSNAAHLMRLIGLEVNDEHDKENKINHSK
jgi:DNA mismatch repair ATPase MutS